MSSETRKHATAIVETVFSRKPIWLESELISAFESALDDKIRELDTLRLEQLAAISTQTNRVDAPHSQQLRKQTNMNNSIAIIGTMVITLLTNSTVVLESPDPWKGITHRAQHH